MTVYLYEYLYRGRPPDSSETSAWHLVLGTVAEHPINKRPTVHVGEPMSMKQAKEAGYELPKIIADINAAVLIEVEDLRTKASALQEANAELMEAVAQLQSRVAFHEEALAERDRIIELLKARGEP